MPAPTAQDIADTVSEWFREKCARGPLGRDTDAYNQVAESIPDLTARLTKLLTPTSAPQSAAAREE